MNSRGAVRTIPARELVLGKGKTALASDEAILRFLLPLPAEHEISAFGKIGERHQVTISKNQPRRQRGCRKRLHPERARCTRRGRACTPTFQKTPRRSLGESRSRRRPAPALGDLLSSEVERVIAGRGSMPYKREAVRGLAQDVFARLIALARSAAYEKRDPHRRAPRHGARRAPRLRGIGARTPNFSVDDFLERRARGA